jgi:hypothetical protein
MLPRISAVRTELFTAFLTPSSHIPGLVLELGHNLFIPHSFQSIIHQSSSHLVLYDLAAEIVLKMLYQKGTYTVR